MRWVCERRETRAAARDVMDVHKKAGIRLKPGVQEWMDGGLGC
jgi:hypothetical protein